MGLETLDLLTTSLGVQGLQRGKPQTLFPTANERECTRINAKLNSRSFVSIRG
jgi:hypothetical protein